MPGTACPAAITVPAARSLRRLRRRSPTARTSRRPCATRRTSRMKRSRPPSAPAWGNTSPSASSGHRTGRPKAMPESAMLEFPGGLYAITPETADTGQLLAQVEAALLGGAAAVQYRDKSGDVARRHEQASELAALCRRYGAPLIVNDDLRLADLTDADGVHLGRDDASLREARIILGPRKFIGASCYQSVELAQAAQAAGADYVAFGSFFASPTKPAAPRARLDMLHSAARVVRVPIVAIGGITLANAPALLDAGADCLAVLSALFDAPDIRASAHALNQLFATESEQ